MSPTAPDAVAATTPSTALCAAARALVAGAQPTFAADAEAAIEKQAEDDDTFYTQLSLIFSENGGSDPISQPVSADAALLAGDYQKIAFAAQQADLDGQTNALTALVKDIKSMAADQVPFDEACGIPAIVPS